MTGHGTAAVLISEADTDVWEAIAVIVGTDDPDIAAAPLVVVTATMDVRITLKLALAGGPVAVLRPTEGCVWVRAGVLPAVSRGSWDGVTAVTRASNVVLGGTSQTRRKLPVPLGMYGCGQLRTQAPSSK